MTQITVPDSLKPIIHAAAVANNIPENFLISHLWHEGGWANWNPQNNVNNDGSYDRGLAQINNKAHPEISNTQANDPNFAINWMAQKDAQLYHQYGDWSKALNVYNSGNTDNPTNPSYASNILGDAGMSSQNTPQQGFISQNTPQVQEATSNNTPSTSYATYNPNDKLNIDQLKQNQQIAWNNEQNQGNKMVSQAITNQPGYTPPQAPPSEAPSWGAIGDVVNGFLSKLFPSKTYSTMKDNNGNWTDSTQ